MILVHGSAAGDVEGKTGREAATWADDPRNQRCDIVDLNAASHRNLLFHRLDVFRRHLLKQLGLRKRRRYSIDHHAAVGHLACHRLGECNETPFRCSVSLDSWYPFFACHRGDVHDAAVLALAHAGQHDACAIESARQVYC